MPKKSFSQIRAEHPSSFLLLIDYDEVELPSGKIEIIAADRVLDFDTGEEMLEAYRDLRHSGHQVMFCSPEYQDRLIIERRPSMRVFG